MSREIKFRAWYADLNKMCGVSKVWFDAESRTPYTLTIVYDISKETDDLEDISEMSVFASQILLLQYSGIKDDNGREIYEGDIIKSHDKILVVGFSECAFDLTNIKDADDQFYLFQEWYQDCEIIGNIYENPELLNK